MSGMGERADTLKFGNDYKSRGVYASFPGRPRALISPLV